MPAKERRRLDLRSHYPNISLSAQTVPLTVIAFAELNSFEIISEIDQRSSASLTSSASGPDFENEFPRRGVCLLIDVDERAPDYFDTFKKALAAWRA